MQLTKKLTLASKSQIRADILSGAGLAFDMQPSGVDEDVLKAAHEGDAPALAIALAEAKAKAVKGAGDATTLIVGADQLLQCEGRLFDKPRNMDEARDNLKFFRGKTHQLIGGVVLVAGGETLWTHHQAVTLTMRDFSNGFLQAYLDEAGPQILNSVGCYQLEGLGAHLFTHIDGDYFATLGLPLLPLLQALRVHGGLAA